MQEINFEHAYYIKLGEGGKWVLLCRNDSMLRFDWPHQSVADINAGRWELIEQQLRAERKPSQATRAYNGLRYIVESGPNDLWYTFSQNALWWTRLAPGPVVQDGISKFRRTSQRWTDTDSAERLLRLDELPGQLAQTQAFRWTVCRAQYPEKLRNVLNGVESPLALAIDAHREALEADLAGAIEDLHPKDFETLVDLVFRGAGWRRTSLLGEQAKGYDLLLEEPITGKRYAVQVKSSAGREELDSTLDKLSTDDCEALYFVVHHPASNLKNGDGLPPKVKLMGQKELAQQAVESGLVNWLRNKAR
jgi:hypothetical protein